MSGVDDEGPGWTEGRPDGPEQPPLSHEDSGYGSLLPPLAEGSWPANVSACQGHC